jgi:hypothetical protein
MLDVKSSYERHLNLSGKPGYDALLTINLKKDIQILEEQRKLERVRKTFYNSDI